MHQRPTSVAVALLTLALAVTALATDVLASGSGRLRRDVLPTFEAITLNLDADTTDYTGSVRIQLAVKTAVDSFQLHSEGLTVKRLTLRNTKGFLPASFRPAGPTMITVANRVPLSPGVYTLDIEFSNRLNTRAQGLYRVEVEGHGYTFSQFESDDARKSFPCWDEPSFKIPYQMTLVVPMGHEAVSNTPIEKTVEGVATKTVVFRRTPPLSSYLLAIATGPFEFAPIAGMSVPGRIVTVKGASGLAHEAATMAPPILSALERYFRSRYPYEKLDLIAVPEFWPGAMENAGAITFRDEVLLFDPKTGSAGQRSILAMFMAHEMAHMWFGDLVTMEWWDDLWLNESFAQWMGDKITDEVYPEYNTGIRELRATQGAMETDSRLSTRAIRQPVSALDNLLQAADELAYQKGQSVLGMFESWLGPEVFRKGVLDYLAAHKNGNAVGADLWDALARASGKDVGAAMGTFLDQGGMPLVTADVLADGRVRLTQKRFLNFGVAAQGERQWRVPIGLKYSDGTKTRTQFVFLAGPDTTVALEGTRAPAWIHPNAGEAGYYRWSLSPQMMFQLAENATDVMTPRERVGLLGNLKALLSAGYAHGDDYMRLLARFASDPRPEVLSAVLDGIEVVRSSFITPDLAVPYARYVRQTLGPSLQRLGLTKRASEDDGVSLVRPTLIRMLGDDGNDPRVLDFADSLAREYFKDPASVDPSLGGVAINLSAIRGDQAMYEDYKRRFEAAQIPAERARYLGALGYFRDPKIVEQSLQYALGGPLRPQEMFTIPGTLARAFQYEELPFRWMTENYEAIASRIPPMFVVYMPAFAGGCSSGRLEAARKFFAEASHSVAGTEKELAKVADQVNDCVGLREREGAAVSAYLNEVGGAK